jgi:uncharacterized Tic20 family protein
LRQFTNSCSRRGVILFRLTLWRCDAKWRRQDRLMNSTNDTALLTTLLTLFAGQLPILLISLVGCLVMMGRWNDGSRAAGWALLGFGLSLALCVIMPVGQTLVQNWVVGSGQSMVQRAWAFTALGLVWSVLRAATYALLLMALWVRQPETEARIVS